MDIPDEVLRKAWHAFENGLLTGRTMGSALDASWRVITEWARKEALREAEAEVHAIPCWGNGNKSGFDVGPDPVRVVRDTMRRLVEGDA